MSRRNPDPKLVANVLELARAGRSAADIQQTLGVPRSTASRWVRAAEVSHAESSMKSDDIEAAVAVLGDDWTISSAAELASVSPEAVRFWLRARVDRLLARKGLPSSAAKIDLQYSMAQR